MGAYLRGRTPDEAGEGRYVLAREFGIRRGIVTIPKVWSLGTYMVSLVREFELRFPSNQWFVNPFIQVNGGIIRYIDRKSDAASLLGESPRAKLLVGLIIMF